MRFVLVTVVVVSACSAKTSSSSKTEGSAQPGSAVAALAPADAAVVRDASAAPATACVTPGFDNYVKAAGSDAALCWHESGGDTCVTVDAAGKMVRTTTPSVIVPQTGPVTRVVSDQGETQDEGSGTAVRVCVNESGTDCKTFKPPGAPQRVMDGESSEDGTLVALVAAPDIGESATLYLFDIKTGKVLDHKALKGGDDIHPGGRWTYLFADHTLIETFTPAATDVSYVSLYVVKGGKLRAAGSSKHDTLGTFHANKRLFVWSKSDADLDVEVFDVATGKLAYETQVKGLLAGAGEPDEPLWIQAAAVGDSVVAAASGVSPARLAYIPMNGPGAAKVVELPTCPGGTP